MVVDSLFLALFVGLKDSDPRRDAAPLLCWPGAECRRYRDALYCSATLPALWLATQL